MLRTLEAQFGAAVVRLAELAQRRKVRAVLKRHHARDGRSTPYLECGRESAPTLVWLHGFGDKPDSFMRAAEPLIRRYRIIAPALPGFGDGWFAPREVHTYESYAAWMGEIARDLGGPRFHLMGNSLGGAIATLIASDDSEGRVASLVLVDSAGIDAPGVRSTVDEVREGHNLFVVRDLAGYERFLARIFARTPWMPRPVRVHLVEELGRSAEWYERVMSDLALSAVSGNIEGVLSLVDLKRIRVPTLVVWGDQDTLFPVAHAEHVARHIPGARLEVLKGVGHCPHIEAPGRLATVIERFLANSQPEHAQSRSASSAS